MQAGNQSRAQVTLVSKAAGAEWKTLSDKAATAFLWRQRQPAVCMG